MSTTFKIILVGASGVGKTSFLARHLTGEFSHKYVSTTGAEVHTLRFSTNYGLLNLNILDCAGDLDMRELFIDLEHGEGLDTKAAIVMFDLGSPDSLVDAAKWRQDILDYCGDVPIVLNGTKCDQYSNEDILDDIYAAKSKYDVYYDVSAKSIYNIEKPFLWLARKLTGHTDLTFVERVPETQC